MEVADAEGLPIEVVNSAVDYFIRRIPQWNREVEVLRKGSKATIYRPTPTMFLLFKIARLSEQDLDDCTALVAWCVVHAEALDRPRVADAIAALPPTADSALAERRQRLAAVLR